MLKRYAVVFERGIGLGAGMYSVVDGLQRRPVGEMTPWKDEAETRARRLNQAEADSYDQDEDEGEQLHPELSNYLLLPPLVIHGRPSIPSDSPDEAIVSNLTNRMVLVGPGDDGFAEMDARWRNRSYE